MSLAGWIGAGSAAAAILTGAALALAHSPPAPLMLELGAMPPAAPAIAALAAAAPQVVDEAPDLAAPPKPLPAPKLPAADPAPKPVGAPAPEVPARADIVLPPQAVPETAKPRPDQRKTRRAKAEPSAATVASAASAAPQQGAQAKGGAKKTSPAAYAKAVMKQVRGTKKQTGGGRGMVVVGFTVATGGGLAGVQVLQSSGNPALDRIALNHIERAAPFPVPPEGAGRSFSFEFVGR